MLSYWIVDPHEPSILALDLVDGGYVTDAFAAGDTAARLSRPLPLDVVPRELVRPRPAADLPRSACAGVPTAAFARARTVRPV